MWIGVNWTSPQTFPVIRDLLFKKKADFCELLIDNFWHHEPGAIAKLFPDHPIAFHIMNSHFIERDIETLQAIGARIKKWIHILKPIYVSDHLARFHFKGRQLSYLSELDYLENDELIKNRVILWQEMLGVPIILENFPSGVGPSSDPVTFFKKLMANTGAGLLFDFSNAIISQLNCRFPSSDWFSLLKRTSHFHAGGFRKSDTEPPVYLDTHDVMLDPQTIHYMRACREYLKQGESLTTVIERDTDIHSEEWQNELLKARDIFERA